MEYRAAKAIAKQAEEQLRLPRHVTLSSLHHRVELVRHRPIAVSQLPALAGTEACGIWLVLPDRDQILHAPVDSVLHERQIILHELSHMILRHDEAAPTADLTQQLLPDLNTSLVLRVLDRSSFRSDAEMTAEVLADRLALRVVSDNSPALQEVSPIVRVFG